MTSAASGPTRALLHLAPLSPFDQQGIERAQQGLEQRIKQGRFPFDGAIERWIEWIPR